MRLELADAAATDDLGRRLAAGGMHHGIVFLEGELGAGKTALARAILRGRGYPGKVKSPTYTLVEPYRVNEEMVYHLDLYRLSDPEELEWLGLRDMLESHALLLVEWPERGAGYLPAADLRIVFEVRKVGRVVNLYPETALGEAMVDQAEPM